MDAIDIHQGSGVVFFGTNEGGVDFFQTLKGNIVHAKLANIFIKSM